MIFSSPGKITRKNIVKRENVVKLKGLRRRSLPYLLIWILYYAWVVAFATWWTAPPLHETVLGTQLRSVMHIVNLISSAVFVFAIRKEWFVKASRIGGILILGGMLVFFIVPDTRVQIVSAVISSIAIGCVNICILIPFVFTLNNTEKLYAVVLSNVLIQLISLFQEYQVGGKQRGGIELMISLFLLVIALSATIFFKQQHFLEESGSPSTRKVQIHGRVYLTLLFNCAIVILCKGAGKGILNITAVGSAFPVFTWYCIGGLFGCLLYLLIYAFTKKAFIWLGNLTFASVAMGLLCNAFVQRVPDLAVAFAILLGVGSAVGMINMYYIIGVVGKKYNSMRYLRLSILLIGICGGGSGIMVGNYISNIGTFEISVMASVLSAAVMILFMAVSPIMMQVNFENDWGRDSQNIDIDQEPFSVFKKYELSRRETEVCKLLLQGYTLRQVSGILSIAYSTVNTHCTSAYRKLGINSRTELLLLFQNIPV